MTLQAAEILLRIVEAVGVIDAQAIELAAAHELKSEPVRVLEYGLVLHAQGGEVVDVEEAPIVDLIRGHAPGGEAIGLRLEELVQVIRACGRGGGAAPASPDDLH